MLEEFLRSATTVGVEVAVIPDGVMSCHAVLIAAAETPIGAADYICNLMVREHTV